MAAERQILCGIGGQAPLATPEALSLFLRGPYKNLTLDTEGIGRAIGVRVDDLFLDLMEIAAYVSGGDQATSRGEPTDSNVGARWHRKFHYVVAVRRPAVWAGGRVRELLAAALGFASEDDYRFDFEPLRDAPSQDSYTQFGSTPHQWFGDRDVIPFSGGLDSFAGATEQLLKHTRNVVLVSLVAASKLGPIQQALVQDLRQACEQRGTTAQVFHLPMALQKDQSLDIERTQRTRSFVFAALAAIVARLLGIGGITFFENGVVSLNLPVCGQVVGARASRTTHAQVLARYAAFFSELFGAPFFVENPFVWKTKAEVVERILENGCRGSIRRTVSCGHVAGSKAGETHCGVCSQCIDRRFGTLAAGAGADDPEDLYQVKLFTGERKRLEEITMLECYVRRARELPGLSPFEFYSRFGEAFRALRWLPGTPDENGQRVYELYQRHAGEVRRVLEDGIAANSGAMLDLRLSPRCLIQMAIDRGAGAEAAQPETGRVSLAGAVRQEGSGMEGEYQPIRVLQVSDTHFDGRRTWDRDPVLKALVRNVEAFVGGGRPLDLIVWTGDVAQSGKASEYKLSEAWLRGHLLPAARLDTGSLVLVPGNHDVDRSKVRENAMAVQEKILKGKDQEYIQRILSDPQQRKTLLDRHRHWMQFVNRMRASQTPLDVPWYRELRTIRGVSVHIAAFCTSWMAHGDDDEKRLLLGRYQVHELMQGAEDADLAIAGMHHPWDYLASFERAESHEEIRRRFALVMRGHLHAADAWVDSRPDDSFLEVAAGACYAGSKYPNSFQYLELDPILGKARLHLRIWDGHDWVEDRNRYRGAAPSAIVDLPLRRGKRYR